MLAIEGMNLDGKAGSHDIFIKIIHASSQWVAVPLELALGTSKFVGVMLQHTHTQSYIWL